MATVVRGILTVLPQNAASLFFAIFAGAIIYFTISFSIYRDRVKEDVKTIVGALFFSRKNEN